MRLGERGTIAHWVATTLLANLVVITGNPLLSLAQQAGGKRISSAARRTFSKLDKNKNGTLEPKEWNSLHAMRNWILARGVAGLPTATLDEYAKLHQEFLRDLLRKHQQQNSNTKTKHFSHEGGEFVGSFQSRGTTKTPGDKFVHKPAVVLGTDNSHLRDDRRGVVLGANRVTPLGFKLVRAVGPDENAKNWSRNEVTLFTKLDRNHDGFVTAEEINESRRLENMASRKSRPSRSKKKATVSVQRALELPARYRNRDGNSDGQIALYEWLGVTPALGVEIIKQYPRVATSRDQFLGASRHPSTNKSLRRNRSRSQLLKTGKWRKPESSRKHIFRRYQKPKTPSSR